MNLRASSVVLRVTRNHYTEEKTEKPQRTTEKKTSVPLRASSVILRITIKYYTERKTEKPRRTTEKNLRVTPCLLRATPCNKNHYTEKKTEKPRRTTEKNPRATSCLLRGTPCNKKITTENPSIEFTSAAHEYKKPGKYKVMVKVVDILGIDTSKVVEVVVK